LTVSYIVTSVIRTTKHTMRTQSYNFAFFPQCLYHNGTWITQ